MSLKYVATKAELPKDTDYECPICFENIDIDEVVDGAPNCVICSNGHRMHNNFYNSYVRASGELKCPLCKSSEFRFCRSKALGYSYVERKGGKIKKTYKKRKTKKRKQTRYKRQKQRQRQ